MTEPIAQSGPADDELLAAIARGDEAALGVLYDRYGRLGFAVAYRVLGEHGAAEDVVQEAFLAVWRRVGSFDPARGNARSWLLTIVRNGAVDRRRGRHGRTYHDTTLDDVDYRLATPAEGVFDVVASSVEAERVRQALRTLPVEQREAIELAYFGGLTQHEIAEQTGTPLGTIKGRMRLGLQKMRGSLADLLPPGPSNSTPEDNPEPAGKRRAPLREGLIECTCRWIRLRRVRIAYGT